jgi:hypothetical protein
MSLFEAHVLIVSATLALFWLAVRSEAKRSPSPGNDLTDSRTEALRG